MGFIRLACLIHAANVHSEPGSNPSNVCALERASPLRFHPAVYDTRPQPTREISTTEKSEPSPLQTDSKNSKTTAYAAVRKECVGPKRLPHPRNWLGARRVVKDQRTQDRNLAAEVLCAFGERDSVNTRGGQPHRQRSFPKNMENRVARRSRLDLRRRSRRGRGEPRMRVLVIEILCATARAEQQREDDAQSPHVLLLLRKCGGGVMPNLPSEVKANASAWLAIDVFTAIR